MADAKPIDDPKRALLFARVLWAGMLFGQALVAVVAWVVISGGSGRTGGSGGSAGSSGVFSVIGLAALLGGTLAGYVLRQQAFKAGWSGHAVSPAAFVKGAILFFAPIEAAGILSSVLAIATGEALPLLALSGLAIAVTVINLPGGSPMDDTLPDLTSR